MRFRKDEALVLQGRRWSKSSYILTCLSREHGKLSVVSKGARRPKSFTGVYHRPGSHVELIWIDHTQRDLFSLVSIDPVTSTTIPVEINRFGAWMRTLKIVKRTTTPESPHPTGFYQLLRTLQAMASDKSDSQLVFIQFVLRWVAELGFPIDWSRCERCGFPVRGSRTSLLIERGVGICNKCLDNLPKTSEEQGFPLTGETYAWLRRLDTMAEKDVKQLTISTRARIEMETVCSLYTEHHLSISLRSSFEREFAFQV